MLGKPDMPEIIPESDQNMVRECKEKLLEHFDTCRIFVSRHDGSKDETAMFDCGGGHFYAQLGQIFEWLEIQRQYQKNWAIRKDAKNQ